MTKRWCGFARHALSSNPPHQIGAQLRGPLQQISLPLLLLHPLPEQVHHGAQQVRRPGALRVQRLAELHRRRPRRRRRGRLRRRAGVQQAAQVVPSALVGRVLAGGGGGEVDLPPEEVPREALAGRGGLVGDHEEALVPRGVVADVVGEEALDVVQLSVVQAGRERFLIVRQLRLR